MRICSLVPGATEVLFALGLGDSVVGVHHALADGGADSGRGRCFEYGVGVMHRLHRQNGGRATAKHLQACEARGRTQ